MLILVGNYCSHVDWLGWTHTLDLPLFLSHLFQNENFYVNVECKYQLRDIYAFHQFLYSRKFKYFQTNKRQCYTGIAQLGPCCKYS